MVSKLKVCCPQCGTVSDVKELTETGWLPCVLPTGFEWTLPSGKITPVVGKPIYIDAEGTQMSYEEFLKKYNVDPDIAYTKMRVTIGSPKPNPVGAGNKPKKEPVQLGGKKRQDGQDMVETKLVSIHVEIVEMIEEQTTSGRGNTRELRTRFDQSGLESELGGLVKQLKDAIK